VEKPFQVWFGRFAVIDAVEVRYVSKKEDYRSLTV
jgi:hypothetical protein